jgi:hypothetical protein
MPSRRQPLSPPPFPAFGLDGMGAGVQRGRISATDSLTRRP